MVRAVQNKVDTIVASAGTGKTYRLVEEIVAEIAAGTPPHRILATTFTKKAAAELAGRVRAKLIEDGQAGLAAAMLSARIGTVNAVCGSLIAEFAFELGRSPVAEVIAEGRQGAIFARATGAVVEEFGPAISEVAYRFNIAGRGYVLHGRTIRGWQDEVSRAVDLARSNGISADRLSHCAERSAESLIALLPPSAPGATGDDLDKALRAALETCGAEIARCRGTLKATTLSKDVPIVERALRTLSAGDRIAWPDWARLAKLGATKADAPMFADIVAAAIAHPRHPALKADIREHISLVFACAARCMVAYAEYKHVRGLLDFVDQEMLALEIISDPDNASRLRELIGAVFVDEFQDSSPVQIAIFSALSYIAGRNQWVGDPKQSIYGFRDADPALTTAAAAAITAASGGDVAYLRRSYRTRPQLADFVNAAISPNMLRVGMTEAEICFDGCQRTEVAGVPAALSCWPMTGKNKEERTAMLAGRIAGMLDERHAWPVSERSGASRDLRGGDVVVLCRGNAQLGELAAALARHGLRVAVERTGLLDQPEIEFALAAFRWVADASDTLALAELARLATADDSWFSTVFDTDARRGLVAQLPFSEALATIRERAPQLTPAEVLDSLLHADTVMDTILQWGDAEQRLQNLEALRSLVEAYQDEQRSERQAATLAGASVWIADRDGPRQPESRHPDAVNIMTYHGSKGLEWPVVILTELDAAARGSPFGLTAEDEGAPDWSSPLAARSLRYWPWPYGEQQKEVHLDVTAPASPQGVAALAAERLERTRLLYVGMTRARDHLAITSTGSPAHWLNELENDQGLPLVSIAGAVVTVAGSARDTRQPAASIAPSEDEGAAPVEYGRPPSTRVAHPPLRLRPSEAVLQGTTPAVAEVNDLGARIPLVGDPNLQSLGEAIHRFLAADDQTFDVAARTARAEEMLRRWGAPQIAPADLVTIADRLHAFVQTRFAGAGVLREWPVHAVDGLQIVSGRLDLLIDLGDGYVVIDHKSFPGSVALDDKRLGEFAGQVALYARAIAGVTGRDRFEYWIHQPIAGVMTRIEIS